MSTGSCSGSIVIVFVSIVVGGCGSGGSVALVVFTDVYRRSCRAGFRRLMTCSFGLGTGFAIRKQSSIQPTSQVFLL